MRQAEGATPVLTTKSSVKGSEPEQQSMEAACAGRMKGASQNRMKIVNEVRQRILRPLKLSKITKSVYAEPAGPRVYLLLEIRGQRDPDQELIQLSAGLVAWTQRMEKVF